MTHVDLTTVPEQAHPSTDGPPATQAAENPSRHRRVRSWTRSALRDLVYDAAVGVWAVVAFTVLVTGIAVTSSLLVLVIGVFVWVGFAHIVRWMTLVDRALAGWRLQERVSAVYQRPAARGVAPYIKALSSDSQTWKDLAWLAVTSIVGFACGLAVITGAGLVVTYVSMPLWYLAVSHPRTEYGRSPTSACSTSTPWAKQGSRPRSGSR